MDRSRYIFGNEIPMSVYRKAVRTKKKYIKKFGDDSNVIYKLCVEENKTIGSFLDVKNIVIGD